MESLHMHCNSTNNLAGTGCGGFYSPLLISLICVVFVDTMLLNLLVERFLTQEKKTLLHV